MSTSTSRESEVELEVEKEQEKPVKRPPLEQLVPRSDELYSAIELVLMASPRRQILQGGDLPALEKAAYEAANSGDALRARIGYEAAARVALFEQNEDKFRGMLEKADKFSKEGESFSKMHRVLLQRIDDAMCIAREFYVELDQEKKAAEAAPAPAQVSGYGRELQDSARLGTL